VNVVTVGLHVICQFQTASLALAVDIASVSVLIEVKSRTVTVIHILRKLVNSETVFNSRSIATLKYVFVAVWLCGSGHT